MRPRVRRASTAGSRSLGETCPPGTAELRKRLALFWHKPALAGRHLSACMATSLGNVTSFANDTGTYMGYFAGFGNKARAVGMGTPA